MLLNLCSCITPTTWKSFEVVFVGSDRVEGPYAVVVNMLTNQVKINPTGSDLPSRWTCVSLLSVKDISLCLYCFKIEEFFFILRIYKQVLVGKKLFRKSMVLNILQIIWKRVFRRMHTSMYIFKNVPSYHEYRMFRG